jgi:hypothetical protein
VKLSVFSHVAKVGIAIRLSLPVQHAGIWPRRPASQSSMQKRVKMPTHRGVTPLIARIKIPHYVNSVKHFLQYSYFVQKHFIAFCRNRRLLQKTELKLLQKS